MRRSAAAALALAISSAASAQLAGVVVGVRDGDTLAVKIDERVLNVHLKSVDAPEIGQPYGRRAWHSLVELCDAKEVTVDELGVDRSRRIVGEVHCAGVDAGQEQLRRGYAVSNRQAN